MPHAVKILKFSLPYNIILILKNCKMSNIELMIPIMYIYSYKDFKIDR